MSTGSAGSAGTTGSAGAAGAGPGRDEVVAILAGFGERAPEEVPESVDSMELAWLVHQIEQRYGGSVPDGALVRMTTVTAVVAELAALGLGAGTTAGTPAGTPAGPGGPGAGTSAAPGGAAGGREGPGHG